MQEYQYFKQTGDPEIHAALVVSVRRTGYMAGEKIESWRKEYNNFRPHSSLDGMTPDEVVEMYLKARKL